MKNFFLINTSDHSTNETYYFSAETEKIDLKLFQKRSEKIRYSIDSWQNYFYIHTNKDAPDFKICRCKHHNLNNMEKFIPPKKEVIIGGFIFLENWMIRSEVSNALPKLFVRNIKDNKEEELVFCDEKVCAPGVMEMQKDRNTDSTYIHYSSPKTNGRTFIYNLKLKKKKLVKEQIIPSGHSPENYITERLECKSHDGRMIPLTITRHKKTKLDGTANVLLYGYSSYGTTSSNEFSSSRISLIDRDIIWCTCEARGSRIRGEKWHEEGKMLNKKNTFKDYISSAKIFS